MVTVGILYLFNNENNDHIFPEKNVKLEVLEEASVTQNATLLILFRRLKVLPLKCCVIKQIPLFIVMHQESFLTLIYI